jgi:hypothetical protein
VHEEHQETNTETLSHSLFWSSLNILVILGCINCFVIEVAIIELRHPDIILCGLDKATVVTAKLGPRGSGGASNIMNANTLWVLSDRFPFF